MDVRALVQLVRERWVSVTVQQSPLMKNIILNTNIKWINQSQQHLWTNIYHTISVNQLIS